MTVIWVLESRVFGSTSEGLIHAVRESGHDLVTWKDAWWMSGTWPRLADFNGKR